MAKVRDRNKINKSRTKLYRQVRNSSFMGPVISSLVLMLLFVVIFAVIGSFFLEYILESKFSEEYSKLLVLADICEDETDYKKVADSINSPIDFMIMDKSDKVIFQKGENTCSFDGGELLLSNGAEKYVVYTDSQSDFLYRKKNGYLGLRWSEMWKWYKDNFRAHITTEIASGEGDKDEPENNNELKDELSDELKEELHTEGLSIDNVHNVNGVYVSYGVDENDKKVLDNIRSFHIPLWMLINLNGGEKKFIGKALFEFKVKDMVLVAEVSAGIVLALLVFFIIIIANIISSFVKSRRVVKLFYNDAVTGGHNWSYFLKYGDKRIHGYFTSKKNWATINFVFRNYRNYCLCHSISEGEEMLAKIYDKISESLTKRELCVHASSSNFALLLNYDDEDRLKMRLHELISRLSSMDENHNFAFQAGISFLPGEDSIDSNGETGEKISRKKIFVEDLYNNACAARAVIGDTDESGIKVFDAKLLDEQKWNDIVNEAKWTALNNEEFAVYYQPKYNPRDDSLRGAEALIRWESPKHGFVTPGRFIPIFEKNGFITEIDHYMISHVARDQKAWLDKGYKCVPVSVNVSRAHFIEKDLAEQIRDMVDKENCPHELIEIELTESAFFDDKNAIVETIKKLKSYGFEVSMDDFGSGYSSLNSLKDMPLDVLKLDAEFFRGKNEEDRGEIVVSEAIKLAKSLKMRTVAEGVEEEEQVKFLAEQGCDMIQGFYYAKPMPKEDFIKRMSK